MRQIIILTLSLVALLSCNNQSEKKANTLSEENNMESNSEFESYISTLDQISLPLKHNPLGQLPKISKNYNKKAFKKYSHIWTTQPLGIYYKDNKTIGILDCSIGDWGLTPFLTTYDVNGNKIDSTSMFVKSGQDMAYKAIEHLTLNKDRTIVVIDTVQSWDINEKESDIIEGSMKMTTGKVVYRVLKNGQIEKPAGNNTYK